VRQPQVLRHGEFFSHGNSLLFVVEVLDVLSMDKEGDGESEVFAFGQIAVWHEFLRNDSVDFVVVYHLRWRLYHRCY
jgi:hypothetical protein